LDFSLVLGQDLIAFDLSKLFAVLYGDRSMGLDFFDHFMSISLDFLNNFIIFSLDLLKFKLSLVVDLDLLDFDRFKIQLVLHETHLLSVVQVQPGQFFLFSVV
jgi:hypothetical protein